MLLAVKPVTYASAAPYSPCTARDTRHTLSEAASACDTCIVERVTKSPSSNKASDDDGCSASCAVWKTRVVPWASRDLDVKLRLITVANGDAAADEDDDATGAASFHSLRLAASSSKANLTSANKTEKRLQNGVAGNALFNVACNCATGEKLLRDFCFEKN